MKNIFLLSIFILFGCQTTSNKIENQASYGEPGVPCLSDEQSYSWNNRSKKLSLLNIPLSLAFNMGISVSVANGHVIPGLINSLGITPDEMPICGNWCGVGFPDRTDNKQNNPPALGLLDSACKRHDLCYEQYGIGSCKCDEEFANEVAKGRLTGDMSVMELKTVAYFMFSDCTGGCKEVWNFQKCGKTGKWLR